MRIEAREDAIQRAALDWTIRVQDAGFTDWDGLTAWLEADIRHAERFDTLAVRDAEAVDLLREAGPPMPVHPAFLKNKGSGEERASRGWMRLAAGLAIPVAFSGGLFLYGRGGPAGRAAAAAATIEVATLPAEQHSLTLADGTRIAVAGATRLSIDPTARTATLLAGRATFRVVHDAARPFSVRLGEVTVTDVGTVFDLHRSARGVEIAVAEGVVQLDGAGDGQRVWAGQIARLTDGAAAETASIVPADVGGWKDGRYDYADASIAEIAADLSAATGVQVSAAPDIAARRFAGSIRVAGDPDQALHGVAPLLGLSVRKLVTGWELDGPADADRR